jgi:hypothetical protein
VPRNRSSQSTVSHKSEFTWRQNFELNCRELREDFKWVEQVYEAYKAKKETRPEYVKEID